MIKFFFDAMYYQFFIYNRDKFKLEDPHERTILLFCGILFLPIIALIYPLIKENFITRKSNVQFIIFIFSFLSCTLMLMVRKEHSQMLSFVVTNLLNLYYIIFSQCRCVIMK